MHFGFDSHCDLLKDWSEHITLEVGREVGRNVVGGLVVGLLASGEGVKYKALTGAELTGDLVGFLVGALEALLGIFFMQLNKVSSDLLK